MPSFISDLNQPHDEAPLDLKDIQDYNTTQIENLEQKDEANPLSLYCQAFGVAENPDDIANETIIQSTLEGKSYLLSRW